ncbi:head-tail connector protein [Leuconostoc suionicum]|uniref:head-tail connector protein n=1 Tax=Leuconostoc suionicum TaxID=1511761 RepID=UPI00233EB5C7|nr:head-tail connector protein [Leuconostoc suionicum]MDC2815437.1 head-tail connector protein [Leuconostoc suionicum]
MALVTATDIMNQLHIDINDTEEATIQGLLDFATQYVTNIVTNNGTIDNVVAGTNEKLVNTTLSTIVANLYYDRYLLESGGFSIGVQVLMNNLRNIYKGV